MYWYKPNTILSGLSLLLISGLFSCKPDIQTGGSLYFDLKGYFAHDCSKLTRQNPTVTKTAGYNANSQTKKLKIKNWEKELKLFSGSDINKPAWRQSYTTKADSDQIIYKATAPNVKTQLILIKQKAGKVKYIYILNHEKNILYENTEKLTYVPDSLYLIDKVQKVKFLGTNHYLIKGLVNQ
jgi:hypothetical protein